MGKVVRIVKGVLMGIGALVTGIAVIAIIAAIAGSSGSDASSDVESDSARAAQADAAWRSGPPEGTYILVEHTVKKFAHDPGSVSVESDACSQTGGDPDDGWLVTCRYRGNNAMGATVLNSGTFRIIRVDDGYAALPE